MYLLQLLVPKLLHHYIKLISHSLAVIKNFVCYFNAFPNAFSILKNVFYYIIFRYLTNKSFLRMQLQNKETSQDVYLVKDINVYKPTYKL